MNPAKQVTAEIPAERKTLTTKTGLSLPPRLPLDAWKRIGQELCLIWDASTWWQGDWLIYGQDRYPDRYQRALDESGLDYQTLRNYAWVARKFKPARRRPDLSLQHHAEVASLPEAEQDRWLDRAERNRWSRNKLRSQLQAHRIGARRPVDENSTLSMKIDSWRQRRWQEAAEQTGRDLARWIADVLDHAAEDALQQLRAHHEDEVESLSGAA